MPVIFILKPHLDPAYQSTTRDQRCASTNGGSSQKQSHNFLPCRHCARSRNVVREDSLKDVLRPEDFHVVRCSQAVNQVIKIPVHFLVVEAILIWLVVHDVSAEIPRQVFYSPLWPFHQELVKLSKHEVCRVGQYSDGASREYASDVWQRPSIDNGNGSLQGFTEQKPQLQKLGIFTRLQFLLVPRAVEASI